MPRVPTARMSELPLPAHRMSAAPRWASLIVITSLVLLATAASAAIGPNRGDINEDGTITVVDINCFIAAALAEASSAPQPTCQVGLDADVDLQCDGTLSVLDVQRSILIRLYLLTPDPGIEALLRVADADFDGLHDACEPDTDGDGVIDDLDVCPDIWDPAQGDIDGDGVGDVCDADNCTDVVCPDDANPCTVDTCDPPTGLCGAVVPDGTSCDADSDGCTLGDSCASGACVAGALADCSAVSDACNEGVCASTGSDTWDCQATPVPGPCDDGDACTTGDACSGGQCVGAPLTCADDGNPCTTASCDPVAGCQSVPNSLPCDDSDPCTMSDTCSAGACVGSPDPACQCAVTADCAVYENGNACDGTLTCLNNQCVIDPATVVACTQPQNPCRVSTCTPATGLCTEKDAAAGKPCDDADLCTTNDTCGAGTCGGTPVSCPSDGNPCVDDVCDPSSGTCGVAVPDTTPCDDGDACTIGDACSAAQCGGAPVVCADDSNPCTVDACDPATGACGVDAVEGTPCDADGDGCTQADACSAGVCTAGVPLDCSGAGTACSTGVCTSTGPTAASCVADPTPQEGSPCDDGDLCTVDDTCAAGSCAGSPKSCPDDGDPCTIDACVPATGACASPAPNGTPCDADDDGCTDGDVCLAGSCTAGGAVDCSAVGDACNVGLCESTGPASWQCAADPVPLNGATCDDAEPCTVPDTCDGGSCGGPTFPACEDPAAGLICLLAGLTGETVVCELRVARADQAALPAVNLQGDWVWDGTAATLEQLQDGEKCFAPGICVPWDIPSSFTALQSGHSVNLDPSDPATWVGTGRMLVAHLQLPDTALTDAYVDGPLIQGESLVLTARFVLKKDIPAEAPVAVAFLDVIASDQKLAPLTTEALALVLRTVPAPPPPPEAIP